MRGCLLRYDSSWKRLAGKIVQNDIILIEKMENINLFTPKPKILSEVVIINKCNSKFLETWLTNDVFLNIKVLYSDNYKLRKVKQITRSDYISMINSFDIEDIKIKKY